ncbi:MAG: hypothetical protein AABX89_08700 [Candidatus Thermoplasmatota archaeon]
MAADASAFTAALVGLVSAVVAVASWRALVRTGNRRIAFVIVAFALLAAKNIAKAMVLASGRDEGSLELLFSLADLAAVVLIAAPILSRRP